MIINSISAAQGFTYYCNGANDDVRLVSFIANLRARGFSNFVVRIEGTFVKQNTTAIVIDNSGFTQITLDFSGCNRITSKGAFLNVNNVRVINCAVYHQNNSADNEITTFNGIKSIFGNCRITGAYNGGGCIGFGGSGSKILNCSTEITNNGGTLFGIKGSDLLVDACEIYVKSITASAYGIEVSASFVSNSIFTGETDSADTTASGNGGIGGGYFSNCRFIGKGALKGQGFYLRGGYWLTVNNCVFRGYTKNTNSGWGIGLTGQANDGNTLSLIGINCNQETLSGFSQTKAMEFTLGYGVYIGTFYMAPSVPATISALGSYNRNRT